MTGCRIVGYDGQKIRYLKSQGGERLLSASLVISALGTRPEDALFAPLHAAGLEVHRIGDCREPRGIKDAILEGALIGRAV
jgi:2,4-dienoyl-CoA reductase (NADPH2)